MKTKSYKENNIIPRIGDKVVFSDGWITLKENKEPFSSSDIFTITEIRGQSSNDYSGGINYVCDVSMENIKRTCSFGWLEKVELEEGEVVEEKKKEKKEFTTIEQDMLEVLL